MVNPATQGISPRGIGSSVASRSLVLWDGIPANDPFGCCVYWTQFVPGEVSRVEISRGAATSVFGDRAMSGAIGIFSRPAERLHPLAEYHTANQRTHDLSLGFANLWGRVAISGAARAFTSDGYYIVPANIRGAADRQANVRFVTARNSRWKTLSTANSARPSPRRRTSAPRACGVSACAGMAASSGITANPGLT